MGYIFDYKDSVASEQWHNSQQNQRVRRHQADLLMNLLKPLAHDSILDIGCGTGEMLAFLSTENGFQLSGVDPSPYMLDVARQKLAHRVDLHRAMAEDLPFDDNSFHHAMLINSLEFVDDPLKAIAEAARVAKDRLFIGALNRYTVQGKIKGASAVLEKSLCEKAHFFSVWELKHLIRSVLGPVPVTWRAVNLIALAHGGLITRIEQNTLMGKLPFGSYIGMVVSLVPTYRMRPLPLSIVKKPKTNMAGSPCTTSNNEPVTGE